MAREMNSVGISIDDDLLERLDAETEARDAADPARTVRRSEVAREWLRLGEGVDDLLRNSDLEFPSVREKRQYVRGLVRDDLEAHGDLPDDG